MEKLVNNRFRNIFSAPKEQEKDVRKEPSDQSGLAKPELLEAFDHSELPEIDQDQVSPNPILSASLRQIPSSPTGANVNIYKDRVRLRNAQRIEIEQNRECLPNNQRGMTIITATIQFICVDNLTSLSLFAPTQDIGIDISDYPPFDLTVETMRPDDSEGLSIRLYGCSIIEYRRSAQVDDTILGDMIRLSVDRIVYENIE